MKLEVEITGLEQGDRDVLEAGPGELLGSYIRPAAKGTALYLRDELRVSDWKYQPVFRDYFGLKFVPAGAYVLNGRRCGVCRDRPFEAIV